MVKVGEAQDALLELIMECATLVRHMSPLSGSVSVLDAVEACFLKALVLCNALHISLVRAIQFKMRIDDLKYAEEDMDDDEVHCPEGPIKVVHKYCEGMNLISNGTLHFHKMEFSKHRSLLNNSIYSFAEKQNWLPRYNNRQLRVSLFSELGKISGALECLHPANDINATTMCLIAEELADVCIYLLHIGRVNVPHI